ncbi:MAG: hypothetical protein KDE63_06400 [Novosphingobium sp.]|nr:hypothetical protein [Novosphingobium sp.]
MKDNPSSGALVGWETSRLGQRQILRLQFVTTPPPHEAKDIHHINLALDENQAVQLGNSLFHMAGQTPPAHKKRGWLERLFS